MAGNAPAAQLKTVIRSLGNSTEKLESNKMIELEKKSQTIILVMKIPIVLIFGFVLVSCTSLESQAEFTPTFPYPLSGTINSQATSTSPSSPTSSPTKRIIPTFTPPPTRTSRPTPKDFHFTPIILPTGAPLGDGLLYEDYIYFTMTTCSNYWVYPAEDPCFQLMACGWGDDYDSGVIHVLDSCGGPGGYLSPSPNTGYLRVIGAKGDRVVLESRLGYIYIFDISEMDLVDSLIDQ